MNKTIELSLYPEGYIEIPVDNIRLISARWKGAAVTYTDEDGQRKTIEVREAPVRIKSMMK